MAADALMRWAGMDSDSDAGLGARIDRIRRLRESGGPPAAPALPWQAGTVPPR
jgi:hypothetical protein